MAARKTSTAQMNVTLMALRKQRGINQKDLAKRIGLGTNHYPIVLLERFGWIPPRVVRQRLAVLLHSTEQALFADALSELAAR